MKNAYTGRSGSGADSTLVTSLQSFPTQEFFKGKKNSNYTHHELALQLFSNKKYLYKFYFYFYRKNNNSNL